MPLKSCTSNGKSGWKWGDSGHCYTGPGAKKAAVKQGLAENNGKGLAELYEDYDITSAELEEVFDELSVMQRTIAYISKKERDKVPSEDFGDPVDRKYPIRNQHDLDSAAKLIGRAPASKQAAIKARIKEIAKRKGLTLPKSWQ